MTNCTWDNWWETPTRNTVTQDDTCEKCGWHVDSCHCSGGVPTTWDTCHVCGTSWEVGPNDPNGHVCPNPDCR